MAVPERDHETFVNVVCDGNIEEVVRRLDKGASPNGPTKCHAYMRPLAAALNCCHPEVAEILVTRGAKLKTGSDALQVCIDNAKLNPWVDRIIADACPEISEHLQEAFVHACEKGIRDVAGKLVTACPSPREFTIRRCPLGQAICSRQTEIALWLLDIGFGPQSHLVNEKHPVLYAIVADEPSVLNRLIEHGQQVDQKVRGHQSFFTCIPKLYSRLRHVRNFPQNDKCEVFHEGSLLHVAAVAGSPKCAAILLEAGLDPTTRDSEGRTPTMLAAIGGKQTVDVLKLLPPPDLSDPTAVTDLMTQGLHDGDAAAVQNAIDHGFDVTTPIKTAHNVIWTPLTFAAIQGNVEVLQVLIDAGADLDQSDWTERKRPVIKGIRYLYDNGGLEAFANPASPIDRTALGWAALHGHVSAAERLLSSGADRDPVDALAMTAMHNAALGNKPKTISLLADAGFDLHAEAMDKMTPLHVAAEVNAIQSVKKLVELGADPTRLNKSGESAYLAAKLCGKPGAYRFLESHTPENLRTKKRKAKPPPPSLVGSEEQRKEILADAEKRFGKTAKQLCSAKSRDRIVKLAVSDEFMATAAQVRKKLKCGEWNRWQETPTILMCEDVKISDARILKLQTELVETGAFLLRALSGGDGGATVYLLPTGNLFEVFAAFHTDGINFGIHDELMLAWLMDLHYRHPYRLVAVGHDGLEPRFDDQPEDTESLLRELSTICPPDDDELIATKWLRKRLNSKTPQPFLWWD